MDTNAQDINKNITTKTYRKWADGYKVRAMTTQDAKIVQEWYCGMGMISPFCLDVALSVYPPGGGFYIGEKDGEVVASAIRIPWGDVFYGSLYYVEEKHRGLGYGTRLRDQVAREFVGDKILVVDAVIGKVADTNKKYGYFDGFISARYSGKAYPDMVMSTRKIVKAEDVPFEKLIAYDSKHFVRPDVPVRKAFMEKWTTTGGGTYVALDDSDNVIGFGSMHPCFQKGEHIVGPLYADTSDIAEALLQKFCLDVEGENITINIWTQYAGRGCTP